MTSLEEGPCPTTVNALTLNTYLVLPVSPVTVYFRLAYVLFSEVNLLLLSALLYCT